MSAVTLTLLLLTLTGQTVELRSDKPSVAPGGSARLELRVLDEAGRPLRDARVSLTVDLGTLTEPVATREGVLVATWRAPAQGGPQVALLHAVVTSGAAAGTAGWLALPVQGKVPLSAARFARIRMAAPVESPSWEEPIKLQGFVVDERGSPAASLPALSVSADQGTLGPIEPKGGATFEVRYTAPARAGAPVSLSAATLEAPEYASTLQLEPRPGPLARQGLALSSLRAKVEAASLATVVGENSANARARSQLRPWEPTLAALLLMQSNLERATGLGVRVEGSLRLADLPLEALLQLEGRQNFAAPLPSVNGVDRSFTLGGLSPRLGVRWSQPVAGRGVLFADLSAGVLRMAGALRWSREGNVFVDPRPLSTLGPIAAVGGGLGWPLGPGRLVGQVQWAYAPARGNVSGNLGGLGLGVGYQFLFSGGTSP